jgi:hypothetical protein
MPRLNCYREEGINIVRQTVRFIFTGLLLSCCFQPASAGLFGHIATFAAGAVIAHETEKAVHNYHTNAGGVAADGRYAAVSPASEASPSVSIDVRPACPGNLTPRGRPEGFHASLQ